ncbi:hypothetical protein LCI18_013601 [Fusarium solani-melongenae]|uniref:Uncharacterized protein n=2 Tax=Fusarium solani subsp. cucurbitae TaxID=2747967 RepID=A0ACD3ZLQ2_FUSSC|nr:hypothetical protein LCI18_013183 [Fusarium solani-melongenae]UPL02667.1 hypothetical protein LCI18_013601 [Fusarium solani-melongenae]
MSNVLIVGAGPVGLFAALRLGQRGVKVELFEKLTGPDQSPRASGYYGPILTLLKESGLWDTASTEGYEENGLFFRTLPVDNGNGGKTFGKQLGFIKDKQLMLPQSKLTAIIKKAAVGTGNVTVHYQAEVTAIEDAGDSVTINVKNLGSGDMETFKGVYLVGCDGGRSTVRSLLKIPFPGHTWPERIITTNLTRVNDEMANVSPHFIIDPVNWAVVIPLSPPKLGQTSHWRYAIAVDSKDSRTDEELLAPENLDTLYEKIMVGKRPLEYKVEQKTVYHIHQRLASTMKRGRCLLAGDAAHLNSPLGAMGLSTGLLDAEALADALIMVLNEGYPEPVLDVYADVRREVFAYFVDPMTTQNKTRIQGNPLDAEREDGFLRLLRNPAIDCEALFQKMYKERWVTDMRSKIATMGIKAE